jgi:hypothetical protein
MERVKSLWLLVAAATLLIAAISAAVVAEPGHAQKCSPVCLPPPEEEFEEEEEVPPPAEEPAPGPRKIRVLVVNVGWGDGSSSEDSPLREGLLSQYVNQINGEVNDWYTQSAPPGAFGGWAAEAGGSYRVSRPDVPSQPCGAAEENEFSGDVILRAHLALEQAGIAYEHFPLMAVVYDRVFCARGTQFNNRVLLSTPDATIHEFGHVLGLGHAHTLSCDDGTGKPVPFGDTCQEQPLADPIDRMGLGAPTGLPFNAAFAKDLGWLNGQYFDVRAPATGTYTIKPFVGSGFSGQRAIRLQDGPTTLWIEFRRPIGLDGAESSPLRKSPHNTGTGVFIRRERVEHPFWEPDEVHTQLLDMTPGKANTSFSLERGQTWANPLGETTVTLDQSGPEGATITVGTRRTATVPNVIGLDPDRAAAIIANAGLWSRSFSPVIDQTCSNIGVVAEQEPFPGVKAIPGTEVRLGVGEHPPFPCP